MDLFTHVLVAYLLSFGLVGFQPSYLAAGAIAGGLPDGDIFFFPLWKRFPILRHHGITHSIFGVTVVAAVGGFLVAPRLASGDPWVYFGIMEAAGLAHMLMDGFTHFSVPPLLPFSDRKLEIDADRAVNFITLIVSVVAFYLLLGVERNHVDFWVYLDTVYALMAFFLVYFALRLTGRALIARPIRAMGPGTVPVPTSNPLAWIVLREERTPERVTTTYLRYTLGRGIVQGPFRVSAGTDAVAGISGPVRSGAEALERSYPVARKHSSLLDDTYHFGEVAPAAEGRWVVVWFSLEFTALGRSAATRVDIAADGSMATRRAWYRPRWDAAPV
ncbi:MAG: metal-dependent hydrolase [Thermoplasmata archaeon]|nr:metal-dependent hydrolase [Thermoplasmata archaeon]